MSQNNNIYILGFMGVGKSITGKLLAEKLNRQFADTDNLIESRAGKPITKIFEQDGEEQFRELETSVLKEAAEENNSVISCGGGIVMMDENMDLIRKSGKSIFLNASIDTLLKRSGDSTERPLLNRLSEEEKLKKIKEILALRLPIYLSADITLDTDDKTPEVIVDELVGLLNR